MRLSMLDPAISFFWPEGMSGLVFVGDEIDVTKFQGTMELTYETKSGYITAGAITDAEWRGMCTMLDEPEWIDDERFATTTARFENAGIRKVMTAVEIAKHDRDELLESLREAESRRPLSSPGSTCSKTRRSPRKKRSRSTTSTASGS